MRKTTSKGRAGRRSAASKTQRRGTQASSATTKPEISDSIESAKAKAETASNENALADEGKLDAQDAPVTKEPEDIATGSAAAESPAETDGATSAEATGAESAADAQDEASDASDQVSETDPESPPLTDGAEDAKAQAAAEDASTPTLADTTPTDDMSVSGSASKDASSEPDEPALAETTSSDDARVTDGTSERAPSEADALTLAETTPTDDMSAPEDSLADAPSEPDTPALATTTDVPGEADPQAPEVAEPAPEQAEEPEPGSMSGAAGAAPAAMAAAAATAGSSGTSSERDSVPPAASAPAAPPPPRSSGRFFPMLLGGVAAGAIGFGAHYLLPQEDDTRDQIAPLEAEIASLESEIADLRATIDALPEIPEMPDLAPLEAEISALRDQPTPAPSSDLEAIESELATLRETLDAADGPDLGPLEDQIAALAAERDEALAAQGSDLDALRAALAETEAQIAALMEDMADLRDLTERRVVEAEAAVDTALAQAGLEMMRVGIETGSPYPQAVAQLNEAGVDVPDVLAVPARDGLPTLEALQEQFPSAARAALREALGDAEADSYVERLTNFFRAQVGARSIAPREGDDPDAVLSRAGAALEAGDLASALDEIADLPETAQAGLGDWLTAAQARVDAEAALPDFTAAITTE